MKAQNQIKRKLSQSEAIEHIHTLLDTSDNLKISELAGALCEQFDFHNPIGKYYKCHKVEDQQEVWEEANERLKLLKN